MKSINSARIKKWNGHLSLSITIVCVILFATLCPVQAQKIPDHDTSYFNTYPRYLTSRFYFSKKYTAFILRAENDQQDLEYRPNTGLNMGIGATYKNFTFNIAFPFGFLNHDDEKGKTKSIDIQFHFFPKKWSMDFLLISHKGLYLYPKDYAAVNPDSYYYRPDARDRFVGFSAYRVLNYKRFSFNAAMLQSEWQKKSAGTLMLGGLAYYGQVKGDSALVPKLVEDGFPKAAGINNANFFGLGGGVGYAYTLVIKKHFYVTGALAGNIVVIFSEQESIDGKKNKVAVDPATIYKGAIGYNSNSWNISGTWAANRSWVRQATASRDFSVPTGNYRIILAKKIALKKH